MIHGMVLVQSGRIVPTCLCGWIGASEKGATAFGYARNAWRAHIEQEQAT